MQPKSALTREEFEAPFGDFQGTIKPWIYTYFKTAPVHLSHISREDIDSLWDFRARLKVLGHFCNDLENLYVRLQVAVHGDKTGMAERFHRRNARQIN